MRTVALPAAAVLAALSLTACSSSSPSASDAASAAGTAASKAAAAASSAATEATKNPTPAATTSAVAASSAAADASSAAAQTTGHYTLDQVRKHSTAQDCWAAIDGSVYDLTSWVADHPGGPAIIQSLCGTDATTTFAGKHGNEAPNGRPQQELAKRKVGTLS